MSNTKKTGKPSLIGNLGKSVDELVYALPANIGSLGNTSNTSNISKPSRIVFTNQLDPEVYKKMRQLEYWGRMGLHEILDNALRLYMSGLPAAEQELPANVAAKVLKKLPL